MPYERPDHFAKRAKAEHYAARSVYKLEEINNRFHVLRRGDSVIDLGASPGSWSQYASKVIGDKGRLLGIDLTEVLLKLPNGIFITQDIFTAKWAELLPQAGITPPVDVVLSDMAPKTTGIKITDQARSYELCEMALGVAQQVLRNGGSFVTKMFDGPDFKVFEMELRKQFASVKVLRPQSTRKESKELFFVAQGFKKI